MDVRHHSTDDNASPGPDHSPGHQAPDNARQWTVADLIDFEYYLDADERELRERPSARKALAERDRVLYLEEIAPSIGDEEPHTPTHRRVSLRRWLAARRNAEETNLRALLPGAVFGSAQRLVILLFAVLGGLVGIGVASALLSYDGTRPVSISWYLFLLVIVQFVLVVSVIGAWVIRRTRGRGGAAPSGLLMHVIRPLVTKVTLWLQGQRFGHAASEIQEQARARQGFLKSQYALYGPVSYLPLLIPAQVFGIAFNVGVIVTTLLLEWFTDLAFGWGSTLNVHPQTIYDLTRLIALPWGWLIGEGVGYPSLEQVAGSRIFLEHWASATPTLKPDPSHLRSWGAFLVLAVITYGLLPRVLLWAGSVLAQCFILARLPFTHSRTQALYARLLSPRLETTPSDRRQGAEMPIPAPGASRTLRGAANGDGPVPAAVARPWRNALVQRTPTTAETPAPQPSGGGEPRVDQAPRWTPPEPASVEPPAGPAQAQPGSDRATAPSGVIETPATPDASTPISAERPPAGRVVPEIAPEKPAPVPEPRPPIEPPEPTAEAPASVTPAPHPTEPLSVPPRAEPAPVQTEAKPKRDAKDETKPGAEPEPKTRDKPAAEPELPVSVSPDQSATLDQATVVRKPTAAPAPEPRPVAPVGRATEPPPPVPDAQAAPGPAPAPAPNLATAPASPPAMKSRGVRFAPDACFLLLHVDIDDILEEGDRPRLEQMLQAHTGWRVAATATFGAGSAMTAEALAVLEQGDWQAPPPRLVIIEDGSQPPITESLRFLRELRATAGTRAQILLALVGDPTDEDRLPPMRPFDFTDWQRKIEKMADPYLRLEMLAPIEDDTGDD